MTDSFFPPAAAAPPAQPDGPDACDRPECHDLRTLFAMQQTRMEEATARWRAADPTTRQHTLPDLGALLSWLMAEIDRARACLDLPANELVPLAQLAAIPPADRRLVGRWLAAQSTMLKPSWLFPAQAIQLARDVLKGAAVDLADPTAEDSSIDHAAHVLHELIFQPAAFTTPQERLEMIEGYATARAAQIEELHATGDPALMASAELEAQGRLAAIRTALGMEVQP